MAQNKPPNITLQALRGSPMPSGYFLGRLSPGVGAVELISIPKANASGLGGKNIFPASAKDDGTNFYIAISDSNGQLVLDAGGNPIFEIEVLPVAAIPAAALEANPTAVAGPVAVNGSALTFMRSDAAPAVQKATSSQFGIVEVDGTTITAAAGVLSLGTPSATTLGGVKSLAAVAHNFLTSITTAGVPVAAQPTSLDLSDITTGSWTPTDASGAGLIFGAATVGHFVKFTGLKLCYIFGFIQMPATASALQMVVGSLPATVSTLGVNGFPLPVDAVTAGQPCFWFFNTNTVTAGLGSYTTGGAVTNATVSGSTIYFALLYPTT